MTQLAVRVRSYVKELGFWVGVALATHRILNGFGSGSGLYWYRFYRQPLVEQAALRPSSAVNFTWLHAYEELLSDLPRPVENLKSRFKQNVRCLISVRDGEIRGCAWFAFNRFDDDEVRCRYILPDTAVWDFDVYIAPKFRLGRLFARLWHEANRELVCGGLTYTLSRISAYNVQSARSHEKLGAQHISSALFLRVGSVQLMLASQRPYVALTLRRIPRLDFTSKVRV